MKLEWEIPCERIEEAFQSKNGLYEPVKIMEVEYDELADAVYISIDVAPEDASALAAGAAHTVEHQILADELAEIA